MKNIFFCLLALLIIGCNADLSKYTQVSENSSYKTKMQACLLNQANAKLQAGTLFSNSITSTAKEIANSCIKQLALQSVSIEQESQADAEKIIQSLKSLTTK